MGTSHQLLEDPVLRLCGNAHEGNHELLLKWDTEVIILYNKLNDAPILIGSYKYDLLVDRCIGDIIIDNIFASLLYKTKRLYVAVVLYSLW